MIQLDNPKLLQTQAFFDGRWQDALSAKTFEVVDPFSNQVLARVADLGVSECKIAIEAADQAFGLWKESTAAERATLLRRWHDLQMDNLEDLARILTHEQGKPLEEAKAEIRYGAAFVEWFAEEARRIYGDIIPGHVRDKRITVVKQPVGVVGAITPWNFPHAMIARKIAPALAAGCSVVVKPSELTPLSALALAHLAEEAGFPPAVFSVLTSMDAPAIGEELCSHPKVKKISFTGSTEVGKILLHQSAFTVKKISLELGGNAPFIVFDDADVDAAVEGAMAAKFRNAGQTCICANRLLVQSGIYEAFAEKLQTAMSRLNLGNGLEKETEIGPLVEQKALERVKKIVADARNKGGRITMGGKVSDRHPLIYEPTLISEASQDMLLFKEEIFGPVAPIFRFETEEEAIHLANDTNYGLASYFYGRDYARIWRVAEALEYGMVGINTGKISTPVAPFGGVKESGFGREGSKYGIDEYVNLKYMCWGGI